MFSETENNDGSWIDEFLDLPSLETDFEFMGNFFFNEIWFEDSDLSPEQWFDDDYFLDELNTIFWFPIDPTEETEVEDDTLREFDDWDVNYFEDFIEEESLRSIQPNF